MSQKIRYAVVGLGHISQTAMLPGFKNAKNSELAAFVSGDSEKLQELGKKYGVKRLCSYEEYDELVKSGEIDAVYIATPNTLHSPFVETAARYGVHVLCEKPLATSTEECERLINIADEFNVKFMVAYRLHFDPANLKAIEIAQSGKLGDLRIFSSTFTYDIKDDDNIRLKSKLGGGPIYDIGIYCINAARYIFRDEPIEVSAFASTNEGDPRFKEVPEMWVANLRFPRDRVASFTCSFGASPVANYSVVGTKGALYLENAYEYAEPMELHVVINEKKTKYSFEKHDQFGPELIYFSDCILNDKEPEPSGWEGLADLHVIEGLVHSADAGIAIPLTGIRKRDWPSEKQKIERPGVRPPKTVNTTSPSGG